MWYRQAAIAAEARAVQNSMGSGGDADADPGDTRAGDHEALTWLARSSDGKPVSPIFDTSARDQWLVSGGKFRPPTSSVSPLPRSRDTR
jgi:hypothetical protein